MRKILWAMTLTVVFTACGKGSESASEAENKTEVNSTTPPPTSGSTNHMGVMMSDTSTAVADSIK